MSWPLRYLVGLLGRDPGLVAGASRARSYRSWPQVRRRSRLIGASFRWLPVIRRVGQGEEHDLFSGHGADVVVQAQHLDACDVLDDGFDDRPRRFDQVRAYLFEQVPTLYRSRTT